MTVHPGQGGGGGSRLSQIIIPLGTTKFDIIFVTVSLKVDFLLINI